MNKSVKLKNLYIVLVFIFLFLPIMVIAFFSFNDSNLNIVFEGFTLEWYKTLFENTYLLESLKNTLIVAFISTSVSTIIGTLSAIALDEYDFHFKGFLNKLLYIPIVIPEIVMGISLLSTYTLFKIDLGMGTIILSHIAFSIPFVIVSVRTSLDSLNKNLYDVASDLNAPRGRTLWEVIIPSILPGILSGALLAFTLSLDDVVISYFTAGPGSNTLPLYLYSIIKTGVTPDVNALATLMILTILIIMTIYIIINYRKQMRRYRK